MNKENKSIEFTPIQIKEFENGVTILMFPVANYMMSKEYIYDPSDMLTTKEEFTETYFPLQIGDKDVWVKETHYKKRVGKEWKIFFDSNVTHVNKVNAGSMTKKQSRYTLKEIIDVCVIRVQDISTDGKCKITKFKDDSYEEEDRLEIEFHNFIEFHNTQLKQSEINRTYKDNDYVFLAEFKR